MAGAMAVLAQVRFNDHGCHRKRTAICTENLFFLVRHTKFKALGRQPESKSSVHGLNEGPTSAIHSVLNSIDGSPLFTCLTYPLHLHPLSATAYPSGGYLHVGVHGNVKAEDRVGKGARASLYQT